MTVFHPILLVALKSFLAKAGMTFSFSRYLVISCLWYNAGMGTPTFTLPVEIVETVESSGDWSVATIATLVLAGVAVLGMVSTWVIHFLTGRRAKNAQEIDKNNREAKELRDKRNRILKEIIDWAFEIAQVESQPLKEICLIS